MKKTRKRAIVSRVNLYSNAELLDAVVNRDCLCTAYGSYVTEEIWEQRYASRVLRERLRGWLQTSPENITPNEQETASPSGKQCEMCFHYSDEPCECK